MFVGCLKRVHYAHYLIHVSAARHRVIDYRANFAFVVYDEDRSDGRSLARARMYQPVHLRHFHIQIRYNWEFYADAEVRLDVSHPRKMRVDAVDRETDQLNVP